MNSNHRNHHPIYWGMFLIAFTTLALEIALSRMLSVITWYHLAFFAISTAMLGMTAGATTVYLKPSWFTQETLYDNVAKASLAYALITPIVLIFILLMPLTLKVSIMSVFALIMVTCACSLPFYFSGLAITAILTKSHRPIGKLYGSDLIGASLGCLFVLVGLEFFDAPSFILMNSAIGILAALCFAWHSPTFNLRLLSVLVFVILIFSTFVNASSSLAIRPFLIDGTVESAGQYVLERWNSFSRIVVYPREETEPQYWGPSPLAPMEDIFQYHINIDGLAGTTMRKFSSLEDIDHLRYDVTNIAYYLRPEGGACIIGVGGARDIQSAILFGHQRILGLDLNPIFINLLQNEFREFAGIADRDEIELVVDEARSFLSNTEEKFSLIQMSLIDTWAATGSGAFTLSENALYTIEGWQIFLNRLKEDGIFTVSRWHNPENLGETGRIVSLAVATLLQSGLTDPAQHIALISVDNISTLLVSKQPFTRQDLMNLKQLNDDLQYDVIILPDLIPKHEVLRKIMSVTSLEALQLAIADETLNYQPPTDEQPYFFNMLHFSKINFDIIFASSNTNGVVQGNLVATLTLMGLILALFIMTLATIVGPLIIKTRSERSIHASSKIFWAAALYFSLIGAGFMFAEIALLQRLSVFLSHPIYSLGILLFTIIASTGVGSLLSDYLPLTRSPWVFLYPIVTALAIIGTQFFLLILLSQMSTADILNRIIASIFVIFPLGILLGFCFPTGMKLVKIVDEVETPWYWALNGIFGVLCSALAVFVSIYFNISTSFYIATISYVILLLPVYKIYKAGQTA